MAAISISLIHPSSHARALNSDSVVSLAASMDKIGLRTPITVKPCSKFRQGQEVAAFEIVTGRHRLEAAKMLGWNEIEAVVMEDDIRACRLWEISENLHRAELTALERDRMVAEWVELVGEKTAQDAQFSQAGPGRGKKEGLSEASRQLGIERTDVHRALKVASLSPEAQETARQAGLDDNRSALLEAARQPTPEGQVNALVQRALRKTERKPLPEPLASEESEERQAADIISKWNKAGHAARVIVVQEILDELEDIIREVKG